MNNKEFITELSQRCGYTQTNAQRLVRTLIDEMGTAFDSGNIVSINGFGSFEVKSVRNASLLILSLSKNACTTETSS